MVKTFEGKTVLMQGNDAMVYAALMAGVRFFAGYPITPSTEILEGFARLMPFWDGKFIQMEDEIGSMAACIGASLAGYKSLTASSGPGISLKLENIGYACMAEVPVTIINDQRMGPSTGAPTKTSQGDMMQARWGAHGDHAIVAIAPATVEEAFWETIRAVNTAELLRNPVFLLPDACLAHMREKIYVPKQDEITLIDRQHPEPGLKEYKPFTPTEDLVPDVADFGEGYLFTVTGLIHEDSGMSNFNSELCQRLVERFYKKIEGYLDQVEKYEEEHLDDCELLVVSYGVASRSASSAVDQAREEGIKAGLFRPITVWPFPHRRLNEVSKGKKACLVVEMNLGQMVREVERTAFKNCPVHHFGTATGDLIPPQQVYEKIVEVNKNPEKEMTDHII
jgi:2-oxoglutarate ferredoxin oxidoreductase subunit alpha